MKTPNQLLLPEVSSVNTLEEMKVWGQRIVDAVRELHRYVWNDLNSGVVTIPPGSIGGAGSSEYMAKFSANYTIANASNTDAEVDSAVSLKHSNSLDHTQNTDTGTSSSSFFLQSATTEGSWRISISGTELLIQRRESSAWVTKGTFS